MVSFIEKLLGKQACLVLKYLKYVIKDKKLGKSNGDLSLVSSIDPLILSVLYVYIGAGRLEKVGGWGMKTSKGLK